MANWKVILDKAEIFPHPNADKLEIVKVGKFQAIAQKGLHKHGDWVVFAPDKSILPDALAEGFRSYLKGPDANRVGSIKLRGEVSMGVVIPLEVAVNYLADQRPGLDAPLEEAYNDFDNVERGEDVSWFLDITKYEPPVPAQMAGDVESRPYGQYVHHDVEGFHAYADEFDPEELCSVTEKLHGTQGIFILQPDGTELVSSKGLFKRSLVLKESEHNVYWRAAKNSKIFIIARLIQETYFERWFDGVGDQPQVAIYGEVIPTQGGKWTYGLNPNNPEVRIFDIRVDGDSLPYASLELDDAGGIDKAILDRWVPIIYSVIPFSEIDVDAVRKGKESVSGEELHIREGVVIKPIEDRLASDGTRLLIKAINPKYKETGEEFS